MKKTILFAAIFTVTSLVFSTNSNAQKGFYFSAQKAPLLSVKFNGSDVHNEGMDYKAKRSKTFGIGGGYNFTNHFGVGAEVMYSKEKQHYSDHLLNYNEQLKFIKIPLVFTYNSDPSSRVMFTAKAGPQLGIMMKSTISNSSNPVLNGDTKDKYNKLSVGAMFGTGARIRLMPHLYADAGLRFDGAITNLESDKYRGLEPGRRKTHSLNAGVELGVRYFLN